MRLYLLRHGVAEDVGPRGDDPSRRLTPAGRIRMERAARGLRALGVRPTVVVTSPFPRAAETAAIVQAACGGELREVAGLEAGVAASDALRALRPWARVDHLMVVGHEPTLGELGALLLTGSGEGLAIALKKGACLAVELDRLVQPQGTVLRWLMTSRQLRRIRS